MITVMNNELIFILLYGLIMLLLIGISYNTLIATSLSTGDSKKIPLYYISTRASQDPIYSVVTGPGYGNDKYRNFSELTEKPCQNETVVIFVHGWEENEDNVKERLNRVKLSLENNSYIHPLIGFSWPSDTQWDSARSIATENGPKLANLISNIKNECPGTDIRLLAHSLGARDCA